MSDEPPRGNKSRQPLIRRAQTGLQGRIEYWQRSPLARRLEAADVINRGLLFSAVLLLCFVPFIIVLQALAGRSQEVGFIRRFGLSTEAAHAVRQALTSPSQTSAAIDGLSWVFFIVGGIAAAAAIQELYERVFEVKGRGFRNTPQRVAWLGLAVGASFLTGLAQPWLDDVGGRALVDVASLIGGTVFWWASMWILLAGKLSWGKLFPSALATGICFLGMEIVFRLTLSTAIVSDYKKYGSIGVVFAIMSLLIAIGVVIILGALLGLVWRERYSARRRLAHYDLAAWPSPSARSCRLTSMSSSRLSRSMSCATAGCCSIR